MKTSNFFNEIPKFSRDLVLIDIDATNTFRRKVISTAIAKENSAIFAESSTDKNFEDQRIGIAR
jgi:hypothetical protein